MPTNTIQPVTATETEMLFCLQSDDQRDFSRLYDRFSPVLFSIILKWIKDREQTENLLQDTFVKAWRNRNLYDAAKGRLFTWLYRISRNICIDHLRSTVNKKMILAFPEEEGAVAKMLPAKESLLTDTIGLRKLVNALRREEKEVVELMYFKGFTQRQIAETMNIPLGTVKTRMNKAIKELRYYYKNDWKTAMRIISLN
jgi:RNA polymerase sigma-70 factor, ECF subfamily